MEYSRRIFLKNAVLAGAGLVLVPDLLSANVPAKTQNQPSALGEICVALIGCGVQGNVLLDAILRMNRTFGVRIVAVCDLWDFKLGATVRRLKANGREVRGYVDFQEMLATEKSLDAVFIATPDFCHAPQTIACLEAGLHVYCEKMMAESIENARAMVRAQRATQKLLQIGHQRRSNPFYQWTQAQLLPAKILGRITHAFAQWNRAVARDVVAPRKFPLDVGLLKKFDYEDAHQFLNWRWFKKYSGGPISDLGAHQIDIFNWFLGTPKSVIAAGGNDYYKNHEWFDNVTCTFEHAVPEGTVRATYQVLTTTGYGDGYSEAFMGDEGSIRLSEKVSLIRAYQEPRSPIDWQEYVRRGLLNSANVPAGEISGTLEGDDFDARATASVPAAEFVFPKKISLANKTIHQPHVENFIRAIRGDAKLTCDAERAFLAEAPIFRVNEAVAAQKLLRYVPADFAL